MLVKLVSRVCDVLLETSEHGCDLSLARLVVLHLRLEVEANEREGHTARLVLQLYDNVDLSAACVDALAPHVD